MNIFITGISTDVGKTVCASIFTEALQADYWKPIQAGDLDFGDSQRVQNYISNKKTVFHKNAYALKTPASPHFSAQIDGIVIKLGEIIRPKTNNHLVIEGAGGVFVPLNDTDCVIDLIEQNDKVVVVSRHYLGSINHTLLTIEALKNRGLCVAGILFSGNKHPSTESIIAQKTGIKIIGRIDEEPYFDQNVILEYADLFREEILNL
jgi:dethiobiotin synthetase